MLTIESANHRIQVFTADGIFLRMIRHETELVKPSCVAIDNTTGMVHVSEGNYLKLPEIFNIPHHVAVFTSEGYFVTSFGRRGEGSGEFICPRGLIVDNNIVLVCDMFNNRVQMF